MTPRPIGQPTPVELATVAAIGWFIMLGIAWVARRGKVQRLLAFPLALIVVAGCGSQPPRDGWLYIFGVGPLLPGEAPDWAEW